MKKTYEFIIIYQNFKMRDGYKTAVITEEFKEGMDPYTFCAILLDSKFIRVDGGYIPTSRIYEVQIREAAAA